MLAKPEENTSTSWLIACVRVCVHQVRAENERLKQSLLAAEQKFHQAMKKHQLAFEEKCRNFKVSAQLQSVSDTPRVGENNLVGVVASSIGISSPGKNLRTLERSWWRKSPSARCGLRSTRRWCWGKMLSHSGVR